MIFLRVRLVAWVTTMHESTKQKAAFENSFDRRSSF
jgi:hypothetical protein